MAIVTLDKITLYGAALQKEETIRRLQELGCVHLLNLGSEDVESERGVAADDHAALKYLETCGQQLQPVRREGEFDRERIVSEVIEIQRTERELIDERAELRKAIADLEPWGEFRLPSDDRYGGIRLWFYTVPLREANRLAKTSLPYHEAARDHQNAYIVVLSENEPEEMPGRPVELDARPLSELRDRLEEVNEQLEDLRYRRAGLTRWHDLLADALVRADDDAARKHASHMGFDHQRLFALSGWAPREAGERIQRFAEESDLALTIQPPAPDEEPPTLLHNPNGLAGAEALVTFYKMPEYRSWDPSIVAYLSFAVFFAMILADAGYGIVFSFVAARYWKTMGRTEGGRRTRNVLATVVALTVLYGILCGSYFGWTPPPDSILGSARIIDAQSQQLMMPLTVIIGVIHLSLANLAVAWLQRGKTIALGSMGWVAVMVGATVAGIAMFADLREASAEFLNRIGLWLLVGGLVAVFLFSSERPFFTLSLKNHALRMFDGLKGLTGISGLFGDVLSYLRLFALGLSSAKLSETFNSLAQGAWDSAGFGVIVAIAIALLGHTLNLALSVMSGVVHGLRLNCIEFFKWSNPEEGYTFEAFAKKAR